MGKKKNQKVQSEVLEIERWSKHWKVNLVTFTEEDGGETCVATFTELKETNK